MRMLATTGSAIKEEIDLLKAEAISHKKRIL